MSATITPATPETAIRAVLGERARALRSRDAAAVVAAYTPDVVVSDLAPPLVQPRDKILDPARLQVWFGTFDGDIIYELRDLSVTAAADVAYCHCLCRLSAVPMGMEQPFDLWFRGSYGLRRVADEWKIAHVHESVPFHMDGTFAAALDLEP